MLSGSNVEIFKGLFKKPIFFTILVTFGCVK